MSKIIQHIFHEELQNDLPKVWKTKCMVSLSLIIVGLLNFIYFTVTIKEVHGGMQVPAIIYTYDQESGSVAGDFHGIGEKKYSIASSYALIETDKEKVIIDYKRNVLFRIPRNGTTCKQFKLADKPIHISAEKDRDSLVQQRMLDLLGSIKVYYSDIYKDILGYQCSKKTVQFAADLRMFRMVVAPVIEKFGQQFSETASDYWVSETVPLYDSIIKTAVERRPVFEANPLLLQIDFMGLLQKLKGFPIQIIRKDGLVRTTETLRHIEKKNISKDVFTVPSECD